MTKEIVTARSSRDQPRTLLSRVAAAAAAAVLGGVLVFVAHAQNPRLYLSIGPGGATSSSTAARHDRESSERDA